MINETAFITQLHAILKGPEVDPYTERNVKVVQLLQGLGVQHLSFAFKEAYEAYPEAFSSDKICADYNGTLIPILPNLIPGSNTTFYPGGPPFFPPLSNRVCIQHYTAATRDTVNYGWMTDPYNVAETVNTNFFSASFISAGVGMSLAYFGPSMPNVVARNLEAEDDPPF